MWWRFRMKRTCVPPQVLLSNAVRCTDEAGHAAEMVIGVTGDGQVTVTAPGGETAVLTPLEVGPLRYALRAAVIEAGRLPVGVKVPDVHPALANAEVCA